MSFPVQGPSSPQLPKVLRSTPREEMTHDCSELEPPEPAIADARRSSQHR